MNILKGSEYMKVNAQGEIYRPAIGMNEPSGLWYILGAARFNNFGNEVEYVPFHRFAELNGQWQYKNGKQKWHVRDRDHGTTRDWMSPNHSITA